MEGCCKQNDAGNAYDDAADIDEGADVSRFALSDAVEQQCITWDAGDEADKSVQYATTESVQGTGTDDAGAASAGM